jgi:uncharacterized protein YjbI with pentapeptide repeats
MNSQIDELLNKVRSGNNQLAQEAIAELREQSWLTDGSLQGVALCKAQLQDSTLESANLCCAGLHQSNLAWVDLSNANLRAAKLSLCNLSGANLKDAKIDNADFYKANLRGARNLTEEQICSAARFWGATMPNGEKYDGRFSLFGDLALAQWNSVNTNDPQAMADFYQVPLDVYVKGQSEKVTA